MLNRWRVIAHFSSTLNLSWLLEGWSGRPVYTCQTTRMIMTMMTMMMMMIKSNQSINVVTNAGFAEPLGLCPYLHWNTNCGENDDDMKRSWHSWRVALQARNEEEKSKWCQCLKKLILDNYDVEIPSSARQSLLMLANNHCLQPGASCVLLPDRVHC